MIFILILLVILSILKSNRYVCFYAYYEKNQMSRDNLSYFLKNGILEEVDYYFIINGECTVNIPKKHNTFIRQNKGYDFGAYNYAIKKIKKKYDYYFFLNTSVRGPFIKNNSKWIDLFINLFNKDVKLVGTTINIFRKRDFMGYDLDSMYRKNPPHSHVQSMFFCIDREYFNYLKTIAFFDIDTDNYLDTVVYKEFALSEIALKNNWNINCILPGYRDVDYRKITKDFNPTSHNGNCYYPGAYFGKTIDPYQVVFFKTNRLKLIL